MTTSLAHRVLAVLAGARKPVEAAALLALSVRELDDASLDDLKAVLAGMADAGLVYRARPTYAYGESKLPLPAAETFQITPRGELHLEALEGARGAPEPPCCCDWSPPARYRVAFGRLELCLLAASVVFVLLVLWGPCAVR